MARITVYNRTKTVLKRAKVRFEGTARNTGFPHCLRATCLTMLALGGMSAAARLRRDLAQLFKTRPCGLEMSRITVYNRTKTVLKRAKVRFEGTARNTGFPHCLRATCLTMLALGGMSATGLAYQAGWSNIAVASHYITVAKAKGLAQREAKAIFG